MNMINKRHNLFKQGVRISKSIDVFGNIHLTAEYRGQCCSCVIAWGEWRSESDIRHQLKQALLKRVA